MSGIASQFGFDLFSSTNSTFSQANIMELLKSRGVISKTLLRSVNINNKRSIYKSFYFNV